MRVTLLLCAAALLSVGCAKKDYSDGSDSTKSTAAESGPPKTDASGNVKGASTHKGLMVPQQSPPNGAQQPPTHP